jgi:hypothetical protein
MTGTQGPCHRLKGISVGEKNVVLIGTDDLIEIIPGTHISSITTDAGFKF